jgi:DNA invertase Pin-like site-specific DNA recombinase
MEIKRIKPTINHQPQRKKVAAYARVSRGTAHMLHSLANQVSHYSKYIQSNSEWEYAGIYADADETGTKDSRPEFQRMLADCRAGKIDIILTKALSRFARNTVTLLETVRELKTLGIDVFFEEQNIHTLSGEGELMLTILASYAQEESRSVSENLKWRIRNDMKSGNRKPRKVYGYTLVDYKLVIIPEQAEVVRLIFQLYLEGWDVIAIGRELNHRGIPSPRGGKWKDCVVGRILINPKMCGDILHQRTYVVDHINKRQLTNLGELPMYLIEDTHEGIIPKDTFEAVQTEIAKRAAFGGKVELLGTAFQESIYCAECGKPFIRQGYNRGKRYWLCKGHKTTNGCVCNTGKIPEAVIIELATKALGLDEYASDVFTETVQRITIHRDQLTFKFHDSTEKIMTWEGMNING